MATLVLTKIWVNNFTSGDAVSAYGQLGRSSEFTVDGEVRTYAGGRQRAVSVEGERSSYSFVLQDVTLAQIVLLRRWFGLPVVVRDHRGQLFYAVFFGLSVAEMPTDVDLYTVAITAYSVTVDHN